MSEAAPPPGAAAINPAPPQELNPLWVMQAHYRLLIAHAALMGQIHVGVFIFPPGHPDKPQFLCSADPPETIKALEHMTQTCRANAGGVILASPSEVLAIKTRAGKPA